MTKKVEREERRKFEAAPTNTDGIFKYIKNFKRASTEIGPINDAKGNIIFKEEEKREDFADYYEGIQATPKPEHIIHNWDSMFDVIDDGKPKLHKIKFSRKEDI